MATSAASGLSISARTVLDALEGEPVRLFVAGGIGTGKSTALEAVRRRLREVGMSVASRPSGPTLGESAVVVDDAHLLDDAALRALAELAEDSDCTIVVAAEPREHDPGLRGLTATLERERSRITLGPLPIGEVSHLLADAWGYPPKPELLSAVVSASAAIPFLVDEIAHCPGPLTAEAARRAVSIALIERLRRLDQTELESLLIASLGTDLGALDLAAALDLPTERGIELIDRARATGLLHPSHPPEFRQALHRAVGHLIGAARHHELESALLRTQLESSTLSWPLAVELVEHGVRDEALAVWLRTPAAEWRGGAADRVRIHRAAVAAGAADMKPALADALASCGDTAAATVLADELLGSAEPGARASGVRIAAAMSAHNGNYAHAAELFDWLGPYPDAAVSAAAALVHTATGDRSAARAALAITPAGPPTAAARMARSLAEGILLTTTAPYPTAAVRLGQAVAGEHPVTAVLPDSLEALVTLAALNNGDAARARTVVDRAVRDDLGGPLFTARHRLLRGWVRMQDGQLAAAAADAAPAGSLRGRDALWAAALRTAIARRAGDTGALHAQWSAGMDALAGYSVDLFSLLPVGELWIAAARLGQQDRLGPALEQGFGVLTALGEPTAWAPLLHWAGVHAGIAAADPAAIAPHGQALTSMAASSAFAAVLAAAGRTWLRVLADAVDADEVIASAGGLARFGLTSDATRLAGQAALGARDGKVSALMLQVARDLKLNADADADAHGEPTPDAPRPRTMTAALSDREREVAELLLLGKPYRDIGAQLFISAKTVEHHVARIRRRLGAESRSEMLSILRAMLAPGGSSAEGSAAGF